MLNVGAKSVQRAARVRDGGIKELQRAVEAGDVSLWAAAEIVRQPQEEQRAIGSRGEKAITEAAKAIRAGASQASDTLYTGPDLLQCEPSSVCIALGDTMTRYVRRRITFAPFCSLILAATALATVVWGDRAVAADPAIVESSVVAGWDLDAFRYQNGKFSHCVTSVRYGKATFLMFSVDASFSWKMSLQGPNANFRQGVKSVVVYSLDDGPKLSAAAVAVSEDQLIIPLTNSVALFQAFRRGRVLKFETAQGTIIPFDLTNSSVALDAALECTRPPSKRAA